MLGAGPAGLTAAHVLALRGQRGTVFEADGIVGGLAKTVECNGYRFDLGGHRFFTKLAPIQRLWETTLGEEFLVRPRLSRIYYEGKYLAYPLQATDVVARLGPYISLFENIATFGRNWLHRYNNQDHSMWTAILATLNMIDGADVWSVNTEADYLEEGDAVEGTLDLDVSFREAPPSSR